MGGMGVCLTVALASQWFLIASLILVLLPFLVAPRGPSIEYGTTLLGMVLGLVLSPGSPGHIPTFDLRDFSELFWILGGALIGALAGAAISWADRRIARGRRDIRRS
jgi:hypothetical protein